MKRFIAAAALALMGSTAAADDVLGTWQSEPGETGGYIHVSMVPCGSKICGRIVDVFEAGGASAAASSGLVGEPIIRNMSVDGGGAYSGGTIWAPDSDRTFRSKMQLNGNSLVVEGCVLGGVICRGQTWSRVN